ncbi:DUF2637 domain-containing protein [Streptomyces abyssomicinicus]|uniref:DUF2637 domain-containing protein n=1 Tax=Streptomyces abyssomicinicus TaxID=574929 RepID=UPI001250C393|nr:DUF2637 domain-containing protein [Streptomyces abyssomicinicus]
MSRIRLDAVLVQALIAGALSFAHLHDLAAAAGQDDWKAWAYPVSVDLLMVAAWRRLRTGGSSRLVWFWFLTALAASLGANIATAGLLNLDDPPTWLRLGVAGWPALAFLGGTLLAHGHHHEHAEPGGEVSAETDEPEPVLEVPAEAPVLEPLPTATAPAAPPPVAVPDVPPALVAHARRLAEEHHTRTGHRIDLNTLRARLGVPAPLAEAIATQLG